MVSHLDELADVGNDSFKIEGRNKQAFYVSTVVGAYRNALDGGDLSYSEKELLTISHRPYSTGFYYGHPSQTYERDGYVKECLHVATVVACEKAEGSFWRVTVKCQNRFELGDTLGVVSPYTQSFDLKVSRISLYTPLDDGKPFAERPHLSFDEIFPLSYESPVEVANRPMEYYVLVTDSSAKPGDILRRATC